MPIKADSWMSYNVWVDWLNPEWVDYDATSSDWASRGFDTRKLAIQFANSLAQTDSANVVLLYERGVPESEPDESGNLFIFGQINAEEEFDPESNHLSQIKSGFGFRWRDGEVAASPEAYTPRTQE